MVKYIYCVMGNGLSPFQQTGPEYQQYNHEYGTVTMVHSRDVIMYIDR